ncbi:MAG: caspase family protein, partial [Bryobacteraceae bacterium]
MRSKAVGIFLSSAFIITAPFLHAQPKKEEPVGLIMSAAGAKLLRSGTETALAARAGDILFTGDVLKSESAAARFAYCPSKSSQALDAGGDVLLEAKQIKVRSGKLSDQKPMGSCFLPQMARVSIASQQHYGVSMVRALKDPQEPVPTPRDKWPPALAAEMADVDKAIAADANDQSAWVARGTLFEKHNLQVDALATYKKIGQEWKDAVWVKGKIFDLSEALASAAAAKEAETPADGKTFALLIGVSKYQKLAQDQWLQFAHADATAFEKLVRSPRGGALPPENVVMLTDEKATTAAMRNAFQTFLKGRAGKKDTVLILMAGHGTVEVPGSKGAYILTHDSDPQDLPGTAMPMADVQALVQEELSKVGRVVLFVDVCRAGNIGSIKSNTVNGVVEKLGEVEQGSILGLMASRPK